MDAIAEKSGVAKGTLFAHFGDKAGLLSHLVADRLRMIMNRPEAGDAAAVSMFDSLLAQSMEMVDLLCEDRLILQIYLDFSGATSSHASEDFLACLDALGQYLINHLVAWAGAEDQPTPLRTDLGIDILASGVTAFITTAAIHRSCGQIESRAACLALLDIQFRGWLISPHTNA